MIAGHGRLMAARKLGMDAVPVIELSHLSPAQHKAYVLADNQLSILSGWDNQLLHLELGALNDLGFDLDVIGFSDGELDRPDHPTPKPLDCFGIPMRQHVARGGLCYEPFAGSGSQIMAGEANGRRVYAMEISEGYVDVAVERWQAETDQEAMLEGGGRLRRREANGSVMTVPTRS